MFVRDTKKNIIINVVILNKNIILKKFKIKLILI